jgi:hypothetical protein
MERLKFVGSLIVNPWQSEEQQLNGLPRAAKVKELNFGMPWLSVSCCRREIECSW